MLASSPPPKSTSGTAAVALPGTPLPSHQGIVLLLLGGCLSGALLFSPSWRRGLLQLFAGSERMLLAGACFVGSLVLVGVVRLRRSMRARAFAQQHLAEPWLWDHPWRKEVVDPALSIPGLLLGFPPFTFLVAAAFSVLGAVAVFTEHGPPLRIVGVAATFFFTLLLLATWKQHVEYLRQWLVRLRYGRMHLRLPGIPLELGSRPDVELVVRRDLSHVSRLRVTLRRVCSRFVTQYGKLERLRDVEYERVQEVGMDGLGPGRSLRLTLELPPPEPAASTVLGLSWRQWELQLTCEAPGVDLDTTFVLPIYLAAPAAVRS